MLDTDFHRSTQIQKPINPSPSARKKQANFFPQAMLHCTFRRQAELN
jgi:hypothetical protein